MSTDDSHYEYSPSVPAAVIFVVTFAVLTVYHVFLLFKNRTFFCLPFVIGGLCEFTNPSRLARIVSDSPKSRLLDFLAVQ